MEIRNVSFRIGLLTAVQPKTKSISVGNLSYGGTGKTPMIKWLLNQFSNKQVAVISRGYGRTSTGFLEVNEEDKPDFVGDEPLEIKTAFPSTEVFVSEKRATAVKKLDNKGYDFLLFDDLYQHQYVRPHCNVLLTSYQKPFYTDFVLPAGRLREFSFNKKRANLILVTKCPNSLSKAEADLIEKKINVSAPVFFMGMDYSEININGSIALVSALANPSPLIEHVSKTHKIERFFTFKDHHAYSEADAQLIANCISKHNLELLTTPKDYVKLKPLLTNYDLKINVIDYRPRVLFDKKTRFFETLRNCLE